MTPEQQRLHEQHKARLARIEGRAYHVPDIGKDITKNIGKTTAKDIAKTTAKAFAKPRPAPVEKFNRTGGGFLQVGNTAGLVGAGYVAAASENGQASGVATSGHAAPPAAPPVQSDNASPATPTDKSATASSSWFRVAGTHLNVRDIQDAVIAHFRMPRVELFARRRNKATVRRRHIAIYLSKVLTIQSLPEIGKRFGGLDHTTILYASRKIERALHKDAALAQDVAELERVLTALEETRT